MTITFVRHTAVDVPKGVCYGATDVELADTFEAEAHEVNKRLEGRRFGAVYTSPLSRAVRLAEKCGFATAIRDSRLTEMNFGEWEMRRWDEIDDPRLQEWYDDFVNVVPTGGESFAQQQQRVRAFIEDMKTRHKGEDVAVFAHGGVIMNAMLIAGTATMENIFGLQPVYGGIVELQFGD